MKLCPQCEFLYEDDQIFCDMDGEGLVYDSRAEVLPGSVAALTLAKPKHSRLRVMFAAVVAGLLLSAFLSFAYYASSHSLESDVVSRSRKPETSLSQQIAVSPMNSSSTQPAANPSQSPTNPDAASESAAAGANEQEDNPLSESARGPSVSKENTLGGSDSRLTIPRRLPPLPQLDPLPRLPPPQRLAAAKPLAKVPVTTTARKQKITNQKLTESSQKALVVEIKPANGKATKRSKVRSFLKKTSRIFTKPFRI